MDTNCEAFTNPVYSANEKITALRALARQANLPEEDMVLLCIIVAQSMEVVQKDFINIVGPLLVAPPFVMENMLTLMEPLREMNKRLLEKPEVLDDVIVTRVPRSMEA